MSRSKLLAIAVLALLLPAPLLAYTIYLKDGSRIVARDKYKIENGQAIIVLQNGTETMIKASEIDEARTAQANTSNLGTALVLDQGKLTDTPTPPPAAPPDLSDMLAKSTVPRRDLPLARRPSSVRQEAEKAGGKTPGGFLDFASLAHNPFAAVDIATDIKQACRAYGLEDVAVFRGTRPDRAFLDITTDSEASVFRTLAIAAKVLSDVRQKYGDKLAAIELLMTTTARDRAGQFVITPEQAADLIAKKVDIPTFYVQNVEF